MGFGNAKREIGLDGHGHERIQVGVAEILPPRGKVSRAVRFAAGQGRGP
jgi:hypothetical protein